MKRPTECVCGRTFAKFQGLEVHMRSCPVEAERSAVVVAAIEAGLGADGARRAEASWLARRARELREAARVPRVTPTQRALLELVDRGGDLRSVRGWAQSLPSLTRLGLVEEFRTATGIGRHVTPKGRAALQPPTTRSTSPQPLTPAAPSSHPVSSAVPRHSASSEVW